MPDGRNGQGPVGPGGRSGRISPTAVSYTHLDVYKRQFLKKIYEGDAKELISTLIQKDLISADEYEDLKEHWKGGDKRE